jgi:hypothetical protein
MLPSRRQVLHEFLKQIYQSIIPFSSLLCPISGVSGFRAQDVKVDVKEVMFYVAFLSISTWLVAIPLDSDTCLDETFVMLLDCNSSSVS